METVTCPYCGTLNKPGAKFCKNCGKQYDESSLQVQPHQPVAYQAAQEAPVHIQPTAQQPQIAAQPAIPHAPKKRKGRILLFGILIGMVGCCAVIGGYYQLFPKPIQNTGNDFLTALQQRNFESAYGMMAPEAQSQLVSAEGLKSFMESNGLLFNSYNSGTMKRISGDPPQAIQIADLVLKDGSTLSIEVDMQVGPDNFWQVIGFGMVSE